MPLEHENGIDTLNLPIARDEIQCAGQPGLICGALAGLASRANVVSGYGFAFKELDNGVIGSLEEGDSNAGAIVSNILHEVYSLGLKLRHGGIEIVRDDTKMLQSICASRRWRLNRGLLGATFKEDVCSRKVDRHHCCAIRRNSPAFYRGVEHLDVESGRSFWVRAYVMSVIISVTGHENLNPSRHNARCGKPRLSTCNNIGRGLARVNPWRHATWKTQ